ncbi:hypothetical protein [Halorubrum sp. C191]|uniref:hypothetical protein n=1 Tax=Halorubrum sp. C191 TaxID=1383842 RepID=UPI001181AE0C|nr:hypothetical protein [Halorubrum sp. C191]
MIDDIRKVGGGIVGVVLVAWIIYEIVDVNPSAFDGFILNVMGAVLLLIIPTGIVVLWNWTD